jgi:hypothetical protein
MNKKMIKIKAFWAFLIYVLSVFFSPAFAEQTVFSVPNADVTPKGRVFLEEETAFRGWSDDRFFLNTSVASYGIGHNTDLDVTLFNVGAPATHNITLATGFKTSVPVPGLKEICPKREIKFTVGSEVLTSLQGQGVGNWTYAHLSGRVPKLNTRLTAGLSYGTKQVFGSENLSFIGAIEQPVTKKVTLITDWYSGKEHWSGYLISGFSYTFKNDKVLYVGYQVPNTPKNGASGFVLEFSKLF